MFATLAMVALSAILFPAVYIYNHVIMPEPAKLAGTGPSLPGSAAFQGAPGEAWTDQLLASAPPAGLTGPNSTYVRPHAPARAQHRPLAGRQVDSEPSAILTASTPDPATTAATPPVAPTNAAPNPHVPAEPAQPVSSDPASVDSGPALFANTAGAPPNPVAPPSRGQPIQPAVAEPNGIPSTRPATAARAQSPKKVTTKADLAQAYSLLNASRFADAAALAQRLTQQAPDQAEAWLVLGAAQDALGKRALAQEAYRHCSEQAGPHAANCSLLLED